MKVARTQVLPAMLAVALAACSGTGQPATPRGSGSAAPSGSAPGTGHDSRIPATPFPTSVFAGISLEPVAAATASKLQAALESVAGRGGMTATVLTANGAWSGAAGSADGEHDLVPESQFGIASVTKSIIAAQVMLLVEAGEVELDRAASEYLPADLAFDTNGATVRQLLSHRSGIPDWYGDAMEKVVSSDRGRVWTTTEVLALVPSVRSAPGANFEYADTNYTVLGLVIENVRQRPLVEVLREGALKVSGTDRLIYQPAEKPADPMAMPLGAPADALERGLGFLPSMSDASSGGAAGAIASDSISLARWWRAFCAGEIVSPASLSEMSRFFDGPDGYGLGVFNVADPWATGIGHAGKNFGYVSSAGCLTDRGLVVTVLASFHVDNISGMGRPLVEALAD